MKNILIITPHYPPSNLAAVHRSRLFAQHLPSFGWNPIILTVHEEFYEEKLDWNLFDLIPNDQRIEKVKAFKIITKPQVIKIISVEEVSVEISIIMRIYQTYLNRIQHK
jgi:hypothetical protein